MSSKSRSKSAPRKPRTEPEEVVEQKPEHHKIEVREGQSRWKFWATIGVVVFTLITFVVPMAIDSLVSGGGRGSENVLSWEHPTRGTQLLSYAEFSQLRRDYGQAREARFALQFGGRMDSMDEITAAGYVIYDTLAQEAGIHVPQEQLTALLAQLVNGGTAQGDVMEYKRTLRSYGLTSQGFEQILRSMLRVERYQALMAGVAGMAEPGAIEALYAEQHTEYSYDYVHAEAEEYAEAAALVEPDEGELATWFGELQPFELRQYEEPVRASAELVGWKVDEPPPAALLEAYPLPEDTDLAVLARNYYDATYFTRFLRPEPLETPDDPTQDTPEEARARTYIPFEEVVEICEREAPVHRALTTWWAEVALRETEAALGLDGEPAEEASEGATAEETADGTEEAAEGDAPDPEAGQEGETTEGEAGDAADEQATEEAAIEEVPAEPETVDLAAEAERLGLFYRPADEQLSREEWNELDEWGAVNLGTLTFSQPNTLKPGLQVGSQALLALRVNDKTEAFTPPLEEIEPQVLESWREDQRAELALDALTALREVLRGDAEGELLIVDEQRFGQLALEAGFEPQLRDWFDGADMSTPADDPDSAALGFLRGQRGFGGLEEGQVPDAQLDGGRQRAYLVRSRGTRDGDLSKMGPDDYQRLKDSATADVRQRYLESMVVLNAEQQRTQFFMSSYGIEDPPGRFDGAELLNIYGLTFLYPKEDEVPDEGQEDGDNPSEEQP